MANHSTRQKTEPKQVIVIRKDLNMSAGKLAAQVSHASLAPILNRMTREEERHAVDWEVINYQLNLDKSDEQDVAIDKWLSGRFTKVVVYVKSEEALYNVFKKAQDKGLICSIIKDAGFTEFDKPTVTCVGIGPCYPEDFEGVTSKLRLFDGEVIPK